MMVYAQQAVETVAAAPSPMTNGLIIFSIVLNVVIFAFGYGKLSNEVKNLKDEVADVKNRVESVEGKVSTVAEGLAELRGTFLAFKDTFFTATKKSSPLTLTRRGDEILRDSGGGIILKYLFEDVYTKFEGITNAYDIQRKAMQIVEDLFEEGDRMSAVKDYLYEEVVHFETVVEVLGVELRDMVFERRGMPVKKRTEELEPSMVRDVAKK